MAPGLEEKVRKLLSEEGTSFPRDGIALGKFCDRLSARWPEQEAKTSFADMHSDVRAVLDKMDNGSKAAAAPPGGGANVGTSH